MVAAGSETDMVVVNGGIEIDGIKKFCGMKVEVDDNALTLFEKI